MKKITVLGAGMVGSAIAIDLSYQFDVTSVDLNVATLKHLSDNYYIKSFQADVNNIDAIKELLLKSDIVVNAVPGFMGYNTLKNILELGKDVVDISFFPEDAFELSALALEKNVTAVVDMGVAPGLSNLILGYQNEKMNVDNFKCFVGGLPKERNMPFQYKAPFSPIDVIEEYTRPSRIKRNAQVITLDALTESEFLNFNGIGTLEAFNTDGLRTLLQTMEHIPNMVEKTLRYPGHIDLMKFLKSAGFFDLSQVNIRNMKVSPIEVTAALLFKHWKLNPNEQEFTVMRIIIEGTNETQKQTVTYNLYDEYDKESKISSMARTTGYSATAVVNILANGMYNEKGIIPPEYIGKVEDCFKFVMNYLKQRNISFTS